MSDNHIITTARVNIINLVMAAIIVLCAIGHNTLLGFVCSIFFAAANFIMMIVFMIKGRPDVFVSNIIWMLLLPVVGFGCCAYDPASGL